MTGPSRDKPPAMKTAYLDCASGIAGDMLLAALIDAGADLATIQQGVDSLRLPGCRIVTREVSKGGFRAVELTVEHDREHAHRHLSDIQELIDGSALGSRQREMATRIFRRLAEAEAKVHGTSIDKVHFHEVGAVDSIADILGGAIAVDLLGIERVVCSPIPTGHGTVRIAHGQVSLPAPATAELLRGVPLAESPVSGELTTPTGAAMATALAESFGPLPSMSIDAIGYGAGKRDYEHHANLLRVMIGHTASDTVHEQVWMLETNLDDLSGELIGHCTSLLGDAGALDVYTTPIQMKKNRPGVVLSVLCRRTDLDGLEKILFRETSTLGVRRWPVTRRTLHRRAHTVRTQWGPVVGKLAWSDDLPVRFAPEFESCRQVATEQGVPLSKVYQAAQGAFDSSSVDVSEGGEQA
jgi:uncharacterized protein (TIGR00299 family) protein